GRAPAATPPSSWPGPTTAASQQVLDLYIIPHMFAQHATGKMTADQAIAWAEKEVQEIYAGRKRRPCAHVSDVPARPRTPHPRALADAPTVRRLRPALVGAVD